ncbi:unnamed protein product [Adineta ricciae]|uniref:Uncharacterized protein n=1 Tax=Adineta ricciae TaxID=249248 RepID=A0A816DEQ6_ADIRI|nr:unnamed protein product [Adineta ricciae]CAF1633866.1 unnamed protein product [Adineta ricciae]
MYKINRNVCLVVLMAFLATISVVRAAVIQEAVDSDIVQYLGSKAVIGCGPCCKCACYGTRCAYPCNAGYAPGDCFIIGK